MDTVLEIKENSNSGSIDLIEEEIRSLAKKLIEALYRDEVQKFLDSTSGIVDEKGCRKVVRNGYHKERTILTTCGYVPVKLQRIDDSALDEKHRFVGRILPPFARRTPTVEGVLSVCALSRRSLIKQISRCAPCGSR